MEISYNELCKRDVINVSDGRCLGRIIDMKFAFPEGKIVGIFVPGRKTNGFFRLFDKTQIYIEEKKILKIGGDVILVDIRGDAEFNPPKKPPKHHGGCPPPFPPDCGNGGGKPMIKGGGISAEQFSSAFDDTDY